MKEHFRDLAKGSAILIVVFGTFFVCVLLASKCDKTEREESKACEPFKKVHSFIDEDRQKHVVCMDEHKNLVVK